MYKEYNGIKGDVYMSKINNKKLVKKCLKKVIEGLLLATIITTVTYPITTVNAEVKSSATTVKKVSRKNFIKDCYARNKTLAEVLTLMEENTVDAANDMWNLENYASNYYNYYAELKELLYTKEEQKSLGKHQLKIAKQWNKALTHIMLACDSYYQAFVCGYDDYALTSATEEVDAFTSEYTRYTDKIDAYIEKYNLQSVIRG